MIQANELRIGNIVQRRSDCVCDILDGGIIFLKVDSVMIRDCEYYKADWAFAPIPLTPEILYKTPFGKKDFMEVSYLCFITIERGAFYLQTEYGLANEKEHQTELPELRYLHQLQNLYFALTGKELNINL